MNKRFTLLRVAFVLILLIACLHTFFILIGGPPLPKTPEYLQMQERMRSIQVDSGAGIMRTTQNFMDGFNIIVSIFLFSLPILSWAMLSEIKNNKRVVAKLTAINLIAVLAFFLTSLSLLAIGGTVVSGLVCLLLVVSLITSR